MNKPQSRNAQRPRDAEGRFESESQAKKDGMAKSKSPAQHPGRQGNPNQPRDADGRFEKKS